MYTEPLGGPQIQHNFRILKDQFNLFDFICYTCEDVNCYVDDYIEDYFDECENILNEYMEDNNYVEEYFI